MKDSRYLFTFYLFNRKTKRIEYRGEHKTGRITEEQSDERLKQILEEYKGKPICWTRQKWRGK